MYDSAINGHSYSTPSSPNAYTTNTQTSDGKPAYDRELASLFRATAANVTQLYKEASEIGQTAYRAGYEQCYNDIWELVTSAQSESQPSNSASGQQQQQQQQQQTMIQQLMELARLKRIAPKTMQFVPNTNRASVLSGQPNQVSSAQASIDGPNSTSPIAQTLSPTRSDNNSSGHLSSEQLSDLLAGVPEPNPHIVQQDITSDVAAENPICSGSGSKAEEKPASTIQRPPRAKRLLESFDSMDIEPPRRRQRKDDIEMA